MRRAGLVGIALIACACTGRPALFRGSPPAPAPEIAPDSLYWKAILELDAANPQGSLDSATAYLDAYLAASGVQPHRREALVLRQLARDARRLARVESALQQVRSDTSRIRANGEGEGRRRDEEAVKEIQRLKDELAKANEELERIRKRLTAPKPPGGR